jgi:hypothetical protein
MHDNSYIVKLIRKGEGQHLDFKFNIPDSAKIARSLVAFSNSEGGILLIGVKDNGQIAGIRSAEEIFMLEGASDLYSRPKIRLQTKTHQIEGKNILEVLVEESKNKPHYALSENGKWLAYIRHQDKNLLANSVLIAFWKRKKRKTGTLLRFTLQEKLLLRALDQSGELTLPEILKIIKLKRFVAERILVNFLAIDIVQIHIQNALFYYRLNPDHEERWQVNNK